MPLKLGADIVVYSATKHIDGQGRSLGGVILGSLKFVEETLQPFLRHTGPALSPMNAWLLLKGLETLELRVSRQSASAETIAKKLIGHKKLSQVLYPTLEQFPQRDLAKKQMKNGGTMLAFSLKGGKAPAFNMMVFSQLLGTSLQPDLDGHVLLLEEVSEYMYRIDRSLFHITSNPAIRRVAGIRLGRVNSREPTLEDAYVAIVNAARPPEESREAIVNAA